MIQLSSECYSALIRNARKIRNRSSLEMNDLLGIDFTLYAVQREKYDVTLPLYSNFFKSLVKIKGILILKSQ